MTIRLVVTDLDGTLWEGDEGIPTSTVRAIHELSRRGVALLAATARGYRSAAHVLRPAGLQPPAVLMSGAVGADLATGQEWHRVSFAAKLGHLVLTAFRAQGLVVAAVVLLLRRHAAHRRDRWEAPRRPRKWLAPTRTLQPTATTPDARDRPLVFASASPLTV